MTSPAKDFIPPPPKHPLDVVRRASELGIKQVIVGFSGGKDALATLELCHQHFGPGNVAAFGMFMVPGLAFQEKYIRYAERRYQLSILSIPHWALSNVFKSSDFRHPTQLATRSKLVKMRDIDEYVRAKTGIDWIATGEKAGDSIERNAIIRRADGIDRNRRRIWPIAWWNDSAVFNFIKQNRIPLPPEYRFAGGKGGGKGGYAKSFGGLWYRDLVFVRDNFPEDWERVKAFFPLVESQISRYENIAAREAEARSGRLVTGITEKITEDEDGEVSQT